MPNPRHPWLNRFASVRCHDSDTTSAPIFRRTTMRSVGAVVLSNHDVRRSSSVVEDAAMVLVNVIIFHGDVSKAPRIANTGTNSNAGQLRGSATLVIVNVIPSDRNIRHSTSRRQIQRDARMVALPGLIAIFHDIVFDEGAVGRRCVSHEHDACSPGIRTGIACDDLFTSAQGDAVVRGPGGTRNNCVVGDRYLVRRRSISAGAARRVAGSRLHIVMVNDDVTPVGHIDDVVARYRHLKCVIADGDVGSSRRAGATAAKSHTKALNIRDDVAHDDDLAHPRRITAGSWQEETALRVVHVIVQNAETHGWLDSNVPIENVALKIRAMTIIFE